MCIPQACALVYFKLEKKHIKILNELYLHQLQY